MKQSSPVKIYEQNQYVISESSIMSPKVKKLTRHINILMENSNKPEKPNAREIAQSLDLADRNETI
jgi:hypothetical protein